MGEPTQNTKPAAAGKALLQEVEAALKGLTKLLGAIRFYPPGHPALKDVTRDARQAFLPLMKGRQSLAVQVRRDGFSCEDKPVPSENPMLQKLAGVLFARRVQRLLILPDISCRDLWNTAQILLIDAAETHRRGGVQEALVRARVSTLWANVVDLNAILQRKEQLDAEKAALYGDTTPEEAEEKFLASLTEEAAQQNPEINPVGSDASDGETLTLEKLLRDIEQAPSDQAFAKLMPQLPPLIRSNLTPEMAVYVWRGFRLAAHFSYDPHILPARREVARQTLAQLATTEILAYYLNLLCDRNLGEEQRLQGCKIAALFGEPVTKLLMARLADEADPGLRKTFIDILVRQGPSALPAITPLLLDERWKIVRNAAMVLGEIRDPAAVEHLRPLMQHGDPRVKREAVRALTRIGGHPVVMILLRVVLQGGEDVDLQRQALLSLGAMKNPAAIPGLVHYLKISDPRVKMLDSKREAVRALGEIGSADALPALIELARSSKIFFRSRHNELRVAAVAAIGEVGGDEAINFLEHISSGSSIVAKAAINALKQARRAKR